MSPGSVSCCSTTSLLDMPPSSSRKRFSIPCSSGRPREPVERLPWYISGLNCLRSSNLSDTLNEVFDQTTLIGWRKMALDHLARAGLGLAGHLFTDLLPRRSELLISKKPRVFLDLSRQSFRLPDELSLFSFALIPQRRLDRLDLLNQARQPSLVILDHRLRLLFFCGSLVEGREDLFAPRLADITDDRQRVTNG